MVVTKRNGNLVPFQKDKIFNAINSANMEVNESDKLTKEEINEIVDNVEKTLEERVQHREDNKTDVEEIQDLVEENLFKKASFHLSQCYSNYRYLRKQMRNPNSLEMSILQLVEGSNSELTKENSNKNAMLAATQRDYMAGEISKELAKKYIFPEDVVEAHNKGTIHIHDMDYALNKMTNCGLVNIEDMLKNGTVMGTTKITTPNSFLVACLVTSQIVMAVAGAQYGGQTVSLAHLAPYVDVSRQKIRHRVIDECSQNNIEMTVNQIEAIVDSRLKQEIKDGIQSLQHQTITMTTTNGQSPFITLFMYLNEAESKQAKKDLAVLIEEVLKQRIVGLPNEQGANVSPVFPKLVYVLEEDNSDENGEYWYLTELAAKCIAKRAVPDCISEKKMLELKKDKNGEGHCFPCMGCLDYNEEIEVDYGTLKIGELAEAFNVALRNEDKIKSFIESNAEEVALCCEFCQNEVSRQGDSCKEYRIKLKKTKNGEIQMVRTKTTNKEDKILIKDISILNRISVIDTGKSKEIILPQGEIQIKSNNKFTNLKGIIINKEVSEWYEVHYRNMTGKVSSFIATNDHPLPVYGKGNEVRVDQLEIGDKLIALDGNKFADVVELTPLEKTSNSYDVTTETGYFDINGKILSHNCRSFLQPYTNKNNETIFYGRFNAGVVTLNLPHIALEADGDTQKFWELLEKYANLAYKAHITRIKRLETAPSDMAPILWQYGAYARLKKGEPIGKLFYDGYMTVSLGYAGIYETVMALSGHSHTSEEGKELAISILKKLNSYCEKWFNETNIYFSVYGTPLESTTYKFAKANQKDFGIIPEITEYDYITNSYHVNVREEIDAFSKLSLESQFQALSQGGAISYIEVPDMSNNIPAVLEVLKYIYNNIMYAELNTRSDYCHECGYDGEIILTKLEDGSYEWKCPNCGNTDLSKMTVIRRVCGYLGLVGMGVNDGRIGDYHGRVLHL